MERREFLKWLGAAAAFWALPGCDGGGGSGSAARPVYAPGVYGNTPPVPYRPTPGQPTGYAGGIAQPVPQAGRHSPVNGYATMPPSSATAANPTVARVSNVQPAPMAPVPASTVPVASGRERWTPPAAARAGATSIYARAAWKAEAPIRAKLRPMGGVNRITVHHDGYPKPNLDMTPEAVGGCIRQIQSGHRKSMGAGDIGYHFVVDRAGRVWQGREEQYQGAHVAKANANNIGVLCLGNYDLQSPTSAQMAALEAVLRQLMARYRVPPAKVFAHRDLANTRCPGDQLAKQLTVIKKRLS